eukprot:scaffold14.g1045.t1
MVPSCKTIPDQHGMPPRPPSPPQEDFDAAAERAKTLPQQTSNDDQLLLYGLFKQAGAGRGRRTRARARARAGANVGDVNTERPGLFDLKGKAKWDAWEKNKGKSKEEAMQDYITLVEASDGGGACRTRGAGLPRPNLLAHEPPAQDPSLPRALAALCTHRRAQPCTAARGDPWAAISRHARSSSSSLAWRAGRPVAAAAPRGLGLRLAASAAEQQPTPAPVGIKLPVKFEVKLKVAFGEHLRVVGSDAALGAWEPSAGAPLAWGEGHVWSATLDLPAEASLEYKFVHIIDGRLPVWEDAPNRCLTPSRGIVGVSAAWNDPAVTLVTEGSSDGAISDSEDLGAPAFKPVVSAAAAEEAAPLPPPAGGLLAEGLLEDGAAALAVNNFAALAAAVPPPAPPAPEAAAPPAAEEAGAEAAAEEGAAEAVAAEDAALLPAAAPSKLTDESGAPKGSKRLLKAVGKTAGAVAMGVAAGAVLSALAIDITDVAILGAVAAAAGGVALNSSGGGKQTAGGAAGAVGGDANGEAGAGGVAAKHSEPGIYLAAGILAAVDGAKKVLDDASAAGAGAAAANDE